MFLRIIFLANQLQPTIATNAVRQMNNQVSISQIERDHGIDFESYFDLELAALEGFETDGLVERNPDRIRIPASGRLLIRNICMVFDRYLSDAAATSAFSKVI